MGFQHNSGGSLLGHSEVASLKNIRTAIFVGTAALLFMTCYTVSTLGSFDKLGKLHDSSVRPLMNAYDNNRDARPIVDLRYSRNTATITRDAIPTCTLPANALNIYEWPATVAGCLRDGVVKAGKCGSSSSGTSISATTAVNVTAWHNGLFCATTMVSTDQTFITSGTTCSSAGDYCGHCSCAPTGGCPINDFAISSQASYSTTAPASPSSTGGWAATGDIVYEYGTTAGKGTAGWLAGSAASTHKAYKATDGTKKAFLIGLQVQAGAPCTNPATHPKHDKDQYPLIDRSSKGCDDRGEDALQRSSGDSTTTPNLFAWHNRASLTESRTNSLPQLEDMTGKEGSIVQLYGQYQIGTKCDDTCRNFRFGENGRKALGYFKKADEWMKCMVQNIIKPFCFLAVAACGVLLVQDQNGQRKMNNRKLVGALAGLLLFNLWCVGFKGNTTVWLQSAVLLGFVVWVLQSIGKNRATQQQYYWSFVVVTVGFLCCAYGFWQFSGFTGKQYKSLKTFSAAATATCIEDDGWTKVLAHVIKSLSTKAVSSTYWYFAGAFGALSGAYLYLLYKNQNNFKGVFAKMG